MCTFEVEDGGWSSGQPYILLDVKIRRPLKTDKRKIFVFRI